MKQHQTYRLSEDNIENVNYYAKKEQRSRSQIVDIILNKYFKEHGFKPLTK